MLPYVRTNRSHCWPLTNNIGLTQIFVPDVLGVLAPRGKARGMEHRGRGYHINRSPWDKGCLLMYSSQSGEFLAGLCTLVQLTTIQLIRWFLYSCTAHNQVNYWLVTVPLYSSQPYNLSVDFRTHVQLSIMQFVALLYSSASCTVMLGYLISYPFVTQNLTLWIFKSFTILRLLSIHVGNSHLLISVCHSSINPFNHIYTCVAVIYNSCIMYKL